MHAGEVALEGARRPERFAALAAPVDRVVFAGGAAAVDSLAAGRLSLAVGLVGLQALLVGELIEIKQ